MAQARVDNSLGMTFRNFLSPDLLILDDLGRPKITVQQSADIYELIISRHRASKIVTTVIIRGHEARVIHGHETTLGAGKLVLYQVMGARSITSYAAQ